VFPTRKTILEVNPPIETVKGPSKTLTGDFISVSNQVRID